MLDAWPGACRRELGRDRPDGRGGYCAGARRRRTVTVVVPAGAVTVPVASSTVPDEVEAMLPTNDGSWNSTGPAGAGR